jgi:hypothetical protein
MVNRNGQPRLDPSSLPQSTPTWPDSARKKGTRVDFQLQELGESTSNGPDLPAEPLVSVGKTPFSGFRGLCAAAFIVGAAVGRVNRAFRG